MLFPWTSLGSQLLQVEPGYGFSKSGGGLEIPEQFKTRKNQADGFLVQERFQVPDKLGCKGYKKMDAFPAGLAKINCGCTPKLRKVLIDTCSSDETCESGNGYSIGRVGFEWLIW